LIVRKLDGELSDEEQLALDRAILRDREARRLLEEYQQIDALAVGALHEHLVDSRGDCLPALRLGTRSRTSRGYSRWWWLMPAAVAAALLAPIALRMMLPGDPRSALVVTRDDGASGATSIDASPIRPLPVSNPIQSAASVSDQSLDRNIYYYYIVGDDGRIYMLEHERLQDVIRRRQGANVRPAGGL
jgi:anti-sigma factor RsiW